LRDLALRTDAIILVVYSIVQEELETGAIVPLGFAPDCPDAVATTPRYVWQVDLHHLRWTSSGKQFAEFFAGSSQRT
jgi:hypothetical protein